MKQSGHLQPGLRIRFFSGSGSGQKSSSDPVPDPDSGGIRGVKGKNDFFHVSDDSKQLLKI